MGLREGQGAGEVRMGAGDVALLVSEAAEYLPLNMVADADGDDLVQDLRGSCPVSAAHGEAGSEESGGRVVRQVGDESVGVVGCQLNGDAELFERELGSYRVGRLSEDEARLCEGGQGSGSVLFGGGEPGDPAVHDGLDDWSAVDLCAAACRGQQRRCLVELLSLEVKACLYEVCEDEPDSVADGVVLGRGATYPRCESFSGFQVALKEQDPLVDGGRADFVDDR